MRARLLSLPIHPVIPDPPRLTASLLRSLSPFSILLSSSYQVGMDRKASDDTCILYCTAGVLLQKLVNDRSLNEFTHIVLDEIHERNSDLDFCLLVVKKLQVKTRANWESGLELGQTETISPILTALGSILACLFAMVCPILLWSWYIASLLDPAECSHPSHSIP